LMPGPPKPGSPIATSSDLCVAPIEPRAGALARRSSGKCSDNMQSKWGFPASSRMTYGELAQSCVVRPAVNWLCGTLRARGVCDETIEACLQVVNEKRGRSNRPKFQLTLRYEIVLGADTGGSSSKAASELAAASKTSGDSTGVVLSFCSDFCAIACTL